MNTRKERMVQGGMKMLSAFPSLMFAILLTSTTSGRSQSYTSGDWAYVLNPAEEATITAYNGTENNVVIPEIIDGFVVRQIGSGTTVSIFGSAHGNQNTNIISVTIPDTVTSIADYAFNQCSALTSVAIPISVTSIGGGAFEGCSALSNVGLSGNVTTIGDYAFKASGLTAITIPDSVTSIGNGTFDGCTSLASVTIGSAVTSIGEFAFYGCTRLISVSIPNGVTSIGEHAFDRCTSLTNVAIPPRFLSTLGQVFDPQLASQLMIEFISGAIVAALPNNYGIATKADLGTAVSNAVSQTVSQVQAQPNSYNLFSADQYAANYNNGVVSGTALVTANPSSYNLYDSNSIMDLRMNGLMVQKNGSDAVVSFQPQTTTDLTQPFTNNGAPITHEVPMPGNKGFLRINAKP